MHGSACQQLPAPPLPFPLKALCKRWGDVLNNGALKKNPLSRATRDDSSRIVLEIVFFKKNTKQRFTEMAKVRKNLNLYEI